MRHATALFLLLVIACGGSNQVPRPLQKIPLPRGAALKPYDPNNPGTPHPYGMTSVDGKVYVALGNLRADYKMGGPGMLAAVVPSTGAVDLIDLGGADGRACQNAGSVKTDGSRLYVSCGGDFNPPQTGHALVEVDPVTRNTRTLAFGASFAPAGVGITADKIWVGKASEAKLVSVDRASFTSSASPVSLECPQKFYSYVPDLVGTGTDLYALCASDSAGVLYRLDPATGVVRGKADVGASPTSLVQTGDGRIAVLCSGDSTLWLATPGTNGSVSASLAYTFASANATLQYVRAFGRFLYTTASSSNTVQKIDISAASAKVVAEQQTGTAPWDVVPLDEDLAVVSNSLSDDLSGIDFRAQAK
jgi:hypothetical protein